MNDRLTLRITIVAICLLTSGCTASQQPLTSSPPPGANLQAGPEARGVSFIIWCDCATVADRQRIAADARKAGAAVLYVYEGFAGIAVASPPGTDPDAFTRRIAAILGVIEVRRSDAVHMQDTNGPAS